MSTRFPDDALLPPDAAPAPHAAHHPPRYLAFVPIVLAFAGVGAILIGSLSIRGGAAVVAENPARTDPVVTGSVEKKPPKDIREILEMLDN